MKKELTDEEELELRDTGQAVCGKKVVENRSWQSTKERFLKSIIKKLGKFTWVGKEEKKRVMKRRSMRRRKTINYL